MVNIDFLNKPEKIYNDGGQSTIQIKSAPYFDYEQYDMEDPKRFRRFIDDLKRIVRNSFEYRQLINYLKGTYGMDECSVLTNVSSRDNTNVKIELHHAPLTLEDICLAVVKRRIAMRENLNINACAYEVMYIHYIRWVGLIPLSSTVHELTHSQYFFIPTDRIYGNYQPFVNTYYNYIEPSVLDSIDNAEQATKDYDNSQMEIFNNHKLYVEVEGYDADKIHNYSNDIRNRIEDIKLSQNGMQPNNNTKKVMCVIVDNTKPR